MTSGGGGSGGTVVLDYTQISSKNNLNQITEYSIYLRMVDQGKVQVEAEEYAIITMHGRIQLNFQPKYMSQQIEVSNAMVSLHVAQMVLFLCLLAYLDIK
jgi:hypothetical protein